ncbi:MAG: glutamine synthetase family protein [Candidatus Obscuribacterales bacterium]|nr:glutamine synthetase family protein [Candidatus Obscuribacterales bacterium]
MDIESILETVEQNDIQLVRFLYCDTSSVIRGKASYIQGLRSRIESGIGLVKGMMAMNLIDDMQADTGYGAVGEIRLVPDLNTFRKIPYAPSSALMLCDMIELDKSPWALCPRNVLKKQIAAFEEAGIRFEAAFEPEFFLGKKEGEAIIPIDNSNCFSTDGMNKAAGFIDSFVRALAAQGLITEQYYPELGHGQHELSIRHAPALEAADNQILYRETLRGVSTAQGLIASLAPKPGVEMPGNGCHLHISAWDIETNTNLFYSDNGLSALGKCFVAGLLKHLPALVALTCPSVNSYRRLKPRAWSSAFTCWGYENREAAVRVPSLYWNHELESANIEIKCVDSSANPYLALAGIMAAGMDGVKRALQPPEPVDADPSSVSTTEANEKKIERLPTSLREACKKLLMDPCISEVLGEEFSRVYLKVKSSEDTHFVKLSAEDEIKAHLMKF